MYIADVLTDGRASKVSFVQSSTTEVTLVVPFFWEYTGIFYFIFYL